MDNGKKHIPTQKQKLQSKQHHKLTPQQIQYMYLLQRSSDALNKKIEEELVENPALEKEEPEEVQESNGIYTTKLAAIRTPYKQQKRDVLIQDQESVHLSTQEELLRQIRFLPLSKQEYLIAQHLIGSLTDAGYLPSSAETIKEEMAIIYYEEVSSAQIEKIRQSIQKMGPPGIASYNLQECLLLQLKSQPPASMVTQAIDIVEHHFELFRKKNYQKLAQKLAVSINALQEIVHYIQQLKPAPIVPQPNQATTSNLDPDFLVSVEQEKTSVLFLEKKTPRLTVSKDYTKLLKTYKEGSSKEPTEVMHFIQQKINKAKWFIYAIEQRKQTLMKIMEAIVKLQKPFFATGEATKLAPIFLRNVAKEIGMDISTVSRAIQHKAVQTHGKVYLLKYFFSEPISTIDGKVVSSHVVKHMIKEIINQEDKTMPYTDAEIAKLLQKKGYLVARRTLAKYRQQLLFPVARLRREIGKK